MAPVDDTKEVMLAGYPESGWYSRAVANRPWTVFFAALTFMGVFCGAGVAVAFTVKENGFKLSGASVGFEARGSVMAGEAMTEGLLMRAECAGTISQSPVAKSNIFAHKARDSSDNPRDMLKKDCYDGYADQSNGRRLSATVDQHFVHDDSIIHADVQRELKYGEWGRNFDPLLVSERASNSVLNGRIDGVTIVWKGDSDLMTADSLRTMHEMTASKVTDKFTNPPWEDFCQKVDYEWHVPSGGVIPSGPFCRPARSLPNYVAALTNTTVADMSSSDVGTVKALIVKCRPLYDAGSLVGNCWNWQEEKYTTKATNSATDPACALSVADQECAKYNAVYDIINALVETSYTGEGDLTTAQTISANESPEDPLALWEEILPSMGAIEGTVEIQGLFLQQNVKSQLFNKKMLSSLDNFGFLFVAVGSLIMYHTGSAWIMLCGMLQITMANAVGFVIYNVVLWRDFFPFLNLVALFLVMGIGADDLFVYVDTWKQSFTLLPPNTPLANRISWVLSKALGAMAITTFTTVVSFLANMVSDLSALKCFGLFTASVVAADFLLMIIFVPAMVTLHHLHFSPAAGRVQLAQAKASGKSVPCVAQSCSGCQSDYSRVLGDAPQPSKADIEGEGVEMVVTAIDADTTGTQVVTKDPAAAASSLSPVDQWHTESDGDAAPGVDDILRSLEACGCCLNCCCCVSTCDPDFCAVPDGKDEEGNHKERWGELFFENDVAYVLLHPIGRWLFFIGMLGVSVWLATHAVNLSRPSSSYVQLLGSEDPTEKYEKVWTTKFFIGDGSSFNYPYIISYGIKPEDNGDVWQPLDRGTPQYTPIDLASSQTYLLETCEKLAAWKYSPQTTSNLEMNPCFMDWFKTSMEVSCGDTGNQGSSSVPWLAKYPTRSSCCGKVTGDFPYPTSEFNTCLGNFATYWASHQINTGLWFDTATGKPKVLQMKGSSTEKYDQTYEIAQAFYKLIKDLYTSLGTPPASLTSGYASTEVFFMAMSSSLQQGAIDSATLSTIFALVVLVMTTRRLVSSIVAAVQIALVVASVIGVFVQLGWELNIVEAIIMSVSVGVACDFSVHLAHSFNESPALEEETPMSFPRTMSDFHLQVQLSTARARSAIKQLGVTLTMGFLTTFAAGFVLLIGELYFFQQFGIFMTTLMAFSISLAFGFLMPMLSSIGWIDRLLANWYHVNITERCLGKKVDDFVAKPAPLISSGEEPVD